MDVSSAQSGTKSSSDFSIERILGSDVNKKEQRPEVPNWLCCTRYQPPRLPRSSSNGCRARRSGRHARVPFTAAQAAALEAAYARAPYLAPPALRALAAALQLREDRIKIWFQNRRARERRDKNAAIAPPHEITLPPTNANSFQAILAGGAPWITHSGVDPLNNGVPSSSSSNIPTGCVTNIPPEFVTYSRSPVLDENKSEDSFDENSLDIESIED